MKKAYMDFYMERLSSMGLLNEQVPPPAPGATAPGATAPGATAPGTSAPGTSAPPDMAAAALPPEAEAPQGTSPTPPDAGGSLPPEANVPAIPPEGEVPPVADESIQFAEYMEEYLKTVSKHADEPDLLRESLSVVREKQDLTPTQRNFVEMNWSSLTLLDERVIVDAQRQIRKSADIASMLNEVETQIDASPDLQQAIQRLSNIGPDKSNMLRQFLAALLGGVVVPGTTGGEVGILPKKSEEKVSLRPQAYTTWGFVDLGPVVLDGKSIEEHLGQEEQKKLEDGAPEERRVLRNRLFIEAITNQLAGGAWYCLVINPDDGSWETVSFSSDFFRDAYENGKLAVVEAAPEPTGELAVDDEGNFVTMASWGLAAVAEVDAGQLDPSTGERVPQKTPVASLKGGRLIWSGDPQAMRVAGLQISSHTWSAGSPEELRKIQRSVPDARAKLMGVS